MKTQFWLLIFISLSILTIYSCKKENSCENCFGDINQLPIANAGSDQIFELPKDSTFLDANGSSDTDGIIVSYLWKQISGLQTTSIKQANTIKTSVRSLSRGEYQFELTVTDNRGASSKDTIKITVYDLDVIRHLPKAYADTDQVIVLPQTRAVLDGSGSTDPDNNIISYEWLKIQGPSVTIVNPNSMQTQIADLSIGVYLFELKVTDATGLFSKDSIQITVTASSIITNGEIVITAPLNYVYLDGSHNWNNNNNCYWHQISGPSQVIIDDIRTSIPWVQNLIPGMYTFRLETGNPGTVLTINVTVVNDPSEKNTVTYHKLKWISGNVYNNGTNYIHIFKPDWLENRPVEVYLNVNSASGWFMVPSIQNMVNYKLEGDSYRLWIVRMTYDQSWIGKESGIKIKFL